MEALGAGPRVRVHRHLAALTFERMVATAFELAPDGVRLPGFAPRAIAGGVRRLVSRRLLDGSERELPALTEEMLDWMSAYRSPAAARLGGRLLGVAPGAGRALGGAIGMAPEASRVLGGAIGVAPGASRVLGGAIGVAHGASRVVGGRDRRSRALGAVLELTLDHGYGALDDAQIARSAGISTEDFHRQFATKEAALLAALRDLTGEALVAVRARMAPAANWPEAVHAGTCALIEHLIANEAFRRIACDRCARGRSGGDRPDE